MTKKTAYNYKGEPIVSVPTSDKYKKGFDAIKWNNLDKKERKK